MNQSANMTQITNFFVADNIKKGVCVCVCNVTQETFHATVFNPSRILRRC